MVQMAAGEVRDIRRRLVEDESSPAFVQLARVEHNPGRRR